MINRTTAIAIFFVLGIIGVVVVIYSQKSVKHVKLFAQKAGDGHAKCITDCTTSKCNAKFVFIESECLEKCVNWSPIETSICNTQCLFDKSNNCLKEVGVDCEIKCNEEITTKRI